MEKKVPSIEEGVGTLSADDRLDIHDLIAEYSYHEDTGNAEAWAGLFTVDGMFDGRTKQVVGHQALVESARKRWDESPEKHSWTHWISNVVIRPTAEGARAHCYQMVVDQSDGQCRVVAITQKVDDLRRESGKWRFHVRRVFPLPADRERGIEDS